MPLDSTHSDQPQNLQLAYQRLLALERFKSGFLARTSHELRSPINTIVSLHQLILEDLCEGPEEEKEFIGQSKDAALKMLALFDQIAAVSKLDVGREPPTLENVDLSFLLPEVEMLTTLQAANQNVRYTVDYPTEEIEVYTDATWLKNILASLIQAIIPQTKFLSLGANQTEQSITVTIECDRPAKGLQSELDAISEATQIDPKTTETDSTKPLNRDIRLSTGLILATAHVALPLIKGEFAITAKPSEEGSYLQCRFPATTA
ncbi:MAG: sensor histidine kinase [Phormidesmis sp.]